MKYACFSSKVKHVSRSFGATNAADGIEPLRHSAEEDEVRSPAEEKDHRGGFEVRQQAGAAAVVVVAGGAVAVVPDEHRRAEGQRREHLAADEDDLGRPALGAAVRHAGVAVARVLAETGDADPEDVDEDVARRAGAQHHRPQQPQPRRPIRTLRRSARVRIGTVSARIGRSGAAGRRVGDVEEMNQRAGGWHVAARERDHEGQLQHPEHAVAALHEPEHYSGPVPNV